MTIENGSQVIWSPGSDKTQVFVLQHFSAPRHLKRKFHIARKPCAARSLIQPFHGTFTEHVDFLFTAVPFKLDSLPPRCLADLPNDPLSQVVSPTLRLTRAVEQHLLFYLREGAVLNWLAMSHCHSRCIGGG